MTEGHKIISADTHVVEPPDLWTSRISPKFKEQVPHLVHAETQDEWWMGDQFLRGVGGVLIQAGQRVENTHDRTYGEGNTITKSFGTVSVEEWNEIAQETNRWEDVPLAAYDPKAWIEEMGKDGLYAGVIYGNFGLYRQPSSPLLTELLRCYNDWLAEFCSYDANRLVGNSLILLDDVPASIKEMERCVKMGSKAIQIPCYPQPHQPYHDPIYEPFWEAAESLGVPLAMHINMWRSQPIAGQFDQMIDLEPHIAQFIGQGRGQGPGFSGPSRSPVDLFCTTDFYIRRATGEMIFSGVFERHPDLHLVCVEFDSGFVPYHVSRMDHTYFEYPTVKFKNDMVPSDFWRRNIGITFQEDPLGLQRLRDLIGPETMMWGNDYPHRESTWPESMKRIEETFKGVPQHEKEMITGGTAAKLWKVT